MAEVYIPAAMRNLTGGERVVTVAGDTVGQLINAIEEIHGGLKDRLLHEGKLRPGMALCIDGETLERGRLNTRVKSNSRVYFVLATAGGLTVNARI